MLKIMKMLKSNVNNNKNIFAFDIETKQKDKINEFNLHYIHQKFQMGCIVGKDLKRTFWNQDDMKDFMLSRQMRDGMIFATNLDFDYNMLFGNDKRLKNSFFVEKNGLMYVKMTDKKHNWCFYDTLSYAKASVKTLGKMLNEPKFEAPKGLGKLCTSYEDKKELQEYCMQDANISYKFACYLRDYCNKLGMKMKITIASTGLDYWRRHYQPCDMFQERREWINLHYMGSFKGGRTEVFKRGKFDDIYGYDYKSHYPAVCEEGIDGKGSYPNPNSVHRIKNGSLVYIETFEGISEVEIKCPYMYIPLLAYKNQDEKLYFPYGKFKAWITHIELREALKNGYEIEKIYDTIYYTENFIPFKKIVDKLYNIRMQFKKENNDLMYNLVKIQMNSGLFGKFAQKINEKSELFCMDDVHAELDGSVYVIKDDKKYYLDSYIERGNYVYNKIKQPEKIPLFIFPILSSYTTAMARIKLWKALIKYPDDIVYTDTDSMYMMKKRFGHSEKLGELEYLGYYPDSLFVKPKHYYLNSVKEGTSADVGRGEKIKMKGVPMRFIEGKKDFVDITCGKPVTMNRFTKIKESAIRKVPYGSIIEMKKILQHEDDKRLWKNKFSMTEHQDSKPLKMMVMA